MWVIDMLCRNFFYYPEFPPTGQTPSLNSAAPQNPMEPPKPPGPPPTWRGATTPPLVPPGPPPTTQDATRRLKSRTSSSAIAEISSVTKRSRSLRVRRTWLRCGRLGRAQGGRSRWGLITLRAGPHRKETWRGRCWGSISHWIR